MSKHLNLYAMDAEELGLGQWRDDETDETYHCPSCGCVGHARVWAWYGHAPADRDDPMDDGDVTCGECGASLEDRDIVEGSGCGDCGRDVVEPGTDYCRACNAAHDAAEAADPLHHHVWQSANDFEATVREITLAQAARP